MKTPCQKLGYKVGDKFKVLRDHICGFKEGATVTLFVDDGSHDPLFSGEGRYSCAAGGPGAYMELSYVKPIKPNKAKRPWIKWEGGEGPVPEGTLVDVKYHDGHKQKGCPVGYTPAEFERNAFFKDNLDPAYNIVAYRLAKPKKAAKPAPEVQAEPTVQREANGRPVGAKVGDWFRVTKSWHFEPGTITTLQWDDGTTCPFFTDTGDAYPLGVAVSWMNVEPCPAPSRPEPEPAKPEWEILWGSEKDFEGAPEWAVYTTPAGHWAEGTLQEARLMWSNTLTETTVNGLRNFQPRSARRLKQPK